MGLFSKKKPTEPVPRPNPPFMPSQPSGDMPLKDRLNLNKSMASSDLPPLPADLGSENKPIQENLDTVSDKLDDNENSLKTADLALEAIDNRISQMESSLPSPQPMASPKPGAKVFIRLDKYTEIINTINNMESKINELKNAINKINDLRNAEQQLVDSWNKLVDEAQAKVNDVSSKLPPANR